MSEAFLNRADVSEALDEFVEECFHAIERSGSAELSGPSAPEFLRERGIDDPQARTITIRHTIEPKDSVPQRIPCGPDGQGVCYPVCRIIKGEQHCVWKCFGCG